MLEFSTFERPRLRVVAATPGLAPGGAEMWLGTLVRSAQRVRYNAIVTASPHNPALQGMFHGTPVIFSGESENADETAAMVTQALLNAVKEHGADLIMYWGFIPMPGLDAANIPVVHVSHSSGIEKTAWHEAHQSRYGDSRAHFLAAVSKSAGQFFVEKVRRKEKVAVIHNGVDLERTRPYLGKEIQRKLWNIPQDAKVALFLGRLSKEKCPETALDAMQHLPEDWYLVMYGWGILEEQLLDAMRNSPAADRIMFPQPRLAGLGDVYGAADVVVIPSMTEAFPLVLIEAWQAGVPVVCAEFKTLLEIEEMYAEGNHMAVHVPCPPSPHQLAKAMQDLNGVPVPQVQAVAMDNFSATAMVGRWEDLFYSCVNEWHRVGLQGFGRKAKMNP